MAKWGEINYPRCAEADDLVQAAIAAALREAVLQVHSSVPGHMLVSDTDRICDAIFALITPDAQAALDRYVKERSDDAVEKMLYHLYLADQHTNLVEKGQTDD